MQWGRFVKQILNKLTKFLLFKIYIKIILLIYIITNCGTQFQNAAKIYWVLSYRCGYSQI